MDTQPQITARNSLTPQSQAPGWGICRQPRHTRDSSKMPQRPGKLRETRSPQGGHTLPCFGEKVSWEDWKKSMETARPSQKECWVEDFERLGDEGGRRHCRKTGLQSGFKPGLSGICHAGSRVSPHCPVQATWRGRKAELRIHT